MSTQTIDSKAKEPETKLMMLKPERLETATDHDDSSSIDFCVQKSARQGILVALYVRPIEEDITDSLPGLKEYHYRDFPECTSRKCQQL